MDQPAFWMAVTAVVTAVGGALVSYLNTKPKLDALQYQIDVLKRADAAKDKMLAECEEKHAKMQSLLFQMLEGKIKHGDSDKGPPGF